MNIQYPISNVLATGFDKWLISHDLGCGSLVLRGRNAYIQRRTKNEPISTKISNGQKENKKIG